MALSSSNAVKPLSDGNSQGTVLGQSWDGFVMLPLSTFEALFGRRQTTVISVRPTVWPTVAAELCSGVLSATWACALAEASRIAEIKNAFIGSILVEVRLLG